MVELDGTVMFGVNVKVPPALEAVKLLSSPLNARSGGAIKPLSLVNKELQTLLSKTQLQTQRFTHLGLEEKFCLTRPLIVRFGVLY